MARKLTREELERELQKLQAEDQEDEEVEGIKNQIRQIKQKKTERKYKTFFKFADVLGKGLLKAGKKGGKIVGNMAETAQKNLEEQQKEEKDKPKEKKGPDFWKTYNEQMR